MKYELTGVTKEFFGHTLHRIKAITDFDNIKAGDLGGFIESKRNLDQCDYCWVGGNACVFDNAHICDDAQVYGNAMVYGNAVIRNSVKVYGNAVIHGNAVVKGLTCVSDNAWVFGDALVEADCQVSGNAHIYGCAYITGTANITKTLDYLSLQGLGNMNSTIFRCSDGNVRIICGCFYGTIDEFEKAIKGDDRSKPPTGIVGEYAKEYLACIEAIKIHFHI